MTDDGAQWTRESSRIFSLARMSRVECVKRVGAFVKLLLERVEDLKGEMNNFQTIEACFWFRKYLICLDSK